AATSPAPAGATEGAAIAPLGGAAVAANEQLVRMTDPGQITLPYGNSYDCDRNNLNFIDQSPLVYPPHNSLNSAVPIAGVPAVNALVNVSDPLSPTARSRSV